jgi:hypothetical protein
VKRRILAAVIGVLMVGSMSTAAYALANDDGSSPAPHGKSGSPQGHKADKPEQADTSEDADGDGPPSWARGHHGKPGDAWKQAWKALTPAQRTAKMAELVQQHADGMKKFAVCVKAAGDDASARSKCVRPLPPGQAKKLLAP